MIHEFIRPFQRQSSVLTQSRNQLINNFYRLILTGVCLIFMLIGIQLTVEFGLFSTIQRTTPIIILIIALWFLSTRNHWSYTIQSQLFLAIIYSGIIFTLYQDGLLGSVKSVLIVWTVLAFLLTGFRGGLVAMSMAGMTLLSAGISQANGHLIPDSRVLEFTNGAIFLRITLSYAVVLGLVIYALFYIMRDIRQSQRRQKELLHQLQSELTLQEKRIQQRGDVLKISTNIGYRISNILDEQTLLDAAIEETLQNKSYDFIQIFLWSDSQRALMWQTGAAQIEEDMEFEQSLLLTHPNNRVVHSFNNDQNLIIGHVKQTNYLSEQIHLSSQTTSEALITIRSQNEVIGVLNVQQKQAASIQENDSLLLETIANQLGVALHNARRYSREQQKTEHETRLNQINQAIEGAQTIEEVLETAALQITQFTHSKNIHIRLGLKDHQS